MRCGAAVATAVVVVLAAGCQRPVPESTVPSTTTLDAAALDAPTTASGEVVAASEQPVLPTLPALPESTVPSTTLQTVPPTTAPPTTVPPTTVPFVAAAMPVDPSLAYVYPIADGVNSGYSPTHSGYEATDIFASCGTAVHSPVHGTVLDLRRTDPWTRAVDDPFTRGGLFVSILGDDGVRYYFAHFSEIPDDVVVGARVVPGSFIGVLGTTGRSSACHVHVAISPLCPNEEWWVRRGVVWPYPYLDAWRSGEQRSPADEILDWVDANPTGCDQP